MGATPRPTPGLARARFASMSSGREGVLMRLSIFVFESTGEESRRQFGRAFGVNWVLTTLWPGLIAWTLSVGILGGLFYAPADDTGRRVVIGVGYGALTLAAIIVHTLGHILSGAAVGARMHSNQRHVRLWT